MIIRGNYIDIPGKRIYPAALEIRDKKIAAVRELPAGEHVPLQYLSPGFIDAHVHIESSMLIPAEFARIAVVHGTVATISDPHEIANVCGMEGVDFMIRNGREVPFHFFFGAPSCVPATPFETSGATLNVQQVRELIRRPDILYLSEMMNFPGVLHGDPEVMNKIAWAKKFHKPIDGHAPGLRGADARKYINAGISTDHECFTAEEALEKLQYGMKIIIREGSAARNFEALAPLINEHWENMMFCSDDKHPDSLVRGHINQLCARAAAAKTDLFKILQMACVNPVNHYKLNVGQLRVGDAADFIVLKDLTKFDVLQTFINGECVAENGKTKIIISSSIQTINHFHCDRISPEILAYPVSSAAYPYPIIEAFDGQLITGKIEDQPHVRNGHWETDPHRDILKIIVINRYKKAPVAMAFIKNFGLKTGAIASSVAHDSHNIVSVGIQDEDIATAVNLLVEEKGGISAVGNGKEMVLALPVAGLMSASDGYQVAKTYTALDAMAKALGSSLKAPFMTLSFMALLVIPHLKLSDLGLFDGDRFRIL
ncbi:MAG: adenine deaminase [Bacteroidota bacterium]|nr:adenine deaminase [Bacteroidota bacterium]MDP4211300.1 adenine deaminase [Bacteroidota bacterium]MDP4250011.1 adenine deaminase [Bacteroidota bacterium]